MKNQNYQPPPLRLEFFELERVELQENPRAQNANIVVDLDFQLIRSKAEEKFGIKLFLVLNKNQKNPKIKGELECISFFGFEDEMDESQKANFIKYQGFAMSYSLLRGVVFQKASSLPSTHRLLPTLNLKSIVEQKSKTVQEDNPS